MAENCVGGPECLVILGSGLGGSECQVCWCVRILAERGGGGLTLWGLCRQARKKEEAGEKEVATSPRFV